MNPCVPTAVASSTQGASRAWKNWRRQFTKRLLDWLTEPIPFPGKWPVMDVPPQQYNKIAGTVVNERCATESRRSA